ncbi:hypothetical protein SLA2020_306630 [Shorea laevis]
MMPGIYDGEGNVIQFTSAGSAFSSSSASSAAGNPCPRCGFHSGLSGVISTCVDCFVYDDGLCLFEYDVSIPYFLAKVRGGTCSIASSDSREVVLQRARYLLKNGFGNYSLFGKNCEDFAIYCKTGRILIGEPNRIGQTIVLSSFMLFTFGLGGVPAAIAYSRLKNEFARGSEAKIPVEILVSRLLSR